MQDIDLETAIRLAQSQLDRDNKHDLVIDRARTETYDFGWVIYYNPRKFVETKNPKYALPGNSPLVVKRNGEIHSIPSYMEVEDAIEKYRKGQ
jgi:Immunity protein 35